MNIDFENIIGKVQSLPQFYNVSYYYLTLNEPTYKLLNTNSELPYFLHSISESTISLLKEQQITEEQLLLFLAEIDEGSFYYFSNMFLIHNYTGIDLIKSADILDKKTPYPSNNMVNSRLLVAALVLHAISNYKSHNFALSQISATEEFHYEINDYNLTKVKDVEFLSKGFIYDDKFYLYHLFIPKDKLNIIDNMPAIFNILSTEAPLNNSDFYLRLDERLAVPKESIISGSLNFEKFRGLNFLFDRTKLTANKNIIVHGNLETLDKLLMVIKKDYDSILQEEVWHIEVESLPNLQDKPRESVRVSFIHGMYYPLKKSFRHIDFTINEYPYKYFNEKFQDVSNSEITIDAYTKTKDSHYKIWCIENNEINEETWYKLVYLSLPSVFRQLFDEIISKEFFE